MKMYKAKDVDGYIAGSPVEARPHLKKVRQIIKMAVPKAEERISWGIPFYKYHGLLGGFAAFKNHVSFGFCAAFQNKDRELLEKNGYVTGKKTIQIQFDQKVPAAAIKQTFEITAKMNEAKTKKKSRTN